MKDFKGLVPPKVAENVALLSLESPVWLQLAFAHCWIALFKGYILRDSGMSQGA